jgi:hypothetical protein
MKGTDPLRTLLGKDKEFELARALAVLARDLDGTSPGTQPEQALLEAEAATIRSLNGRPGRDPERGDYA